ncbi:MAG: helix-turn-helix domain-containing protein [Cyclobacteriaceae bacterium]
MKNIVFDIQSVCPDREVTNFKISTLENRICSSLEFSSEHRHEYFEIIWIKSGKGLHHIDMVEHPYNGSVLFVLTPGQIHKIVEESESTGYVVKFLPSIFKHEGDFESYILDTCLFDNTSTCPVIPVPLDGTMRSRLDNSFSQMVEEFHRPDLDSENILSAHLKILITYIHRMKRLKLGREVSISDAQYGLFRSFKVAIEKSFRKDHSVQFYASKLSTQARTLNKVSRKYAGKSASEMIQERLLLEAQRNLFHESKSVKEIGFDLGFDDPAYFTRFFKKHIGLAPQYFKEKAALS